MYFAFEVSNRSIQPHFTPPYYYVNVLFCCEGRPIGHKVSSENIKLEFITPRTTYGT